MTIGRPTTSSTSMSALASVQRARQNVLIISLPGSYGVGQKRLNSSKWRWVPPGMYCRVSLFVACIDCLYVEWNKDPNKELKKKLKDSKLKGGSAPSLQTVAVGDGQSSNKPKVPPVRILLVLHIIPTKRCDLAEIPHLTGCATEAPVVPVRTSSGLTATTLPASVYSEPVL